MNDTLAERGSRYGDFATHAQITQDMKAVFVASPRWTALSAAQKESLEMVAHKIGRILNGDPNYADSWHDIVGYAKLVEDMLNGPAVVRMTATEIAKSWEDTKLSPEAERASAKARDSLYGKSPVKEIEDQIAHVKSVAADIEKVNPALAQDIKAQAALASVPPQFKLPPAPLPATNSAVDAVAPVPTTDEDKSSQ